MAVLGKDITAEDILDQMSFFDSWEEKYAFIIDLGKQLPVCENCDCIEKNVVKGCQSQVWITSFKHEDKFTFRANSDAIIVKGLLAIIIAAYNFKSSAEILAFDIEDYFAQLDLLQHISNVRGNGLKAMVDRVRSLVA
ncbi:SufE family protein [Psychrobacter sp. HD31]|uniref:SufE family protein n=1 Tax=Psychrobacter sp. HD31 TaxID=3112003 RepID=UPI003DA200FD